MALTEAVKRCGDCKEVVRAFLANGWSPDGRLEVILITFGYAGFFPRGVVCVVGPLYGADEVS